MPKIVMIYDPKKVKCTPNVLKNFGRIISGVVAEVMTTEKVKLDPYQDIDFILQPLVLGSIAAEVSFEIEAIGYTHRKKRVDEHVMREMKQKFLDAMQLAGGFPTLPNKNALIWLKYVDPDGHHV